MQVSEEFLEPELSHVEPKSRRHYTKYQRKDRREEVYKLHMEYGFSARQISNLMKVSRNTINADIKHHYSKLAKEFDELDYSGFYQRQIDRLNEQRARLITTLDKTEDINNKITVERMILDIDSKLIHFALKFIDNNEKNIETIIKELNNHFEREGLKTRYISKRELNKLSVKQLEEIKRIQKQERGY